MLNNFSPQISCNRMATAVWSFLGGKKKKKRRGGEDCIFTKQL